MNLLYITLHDEQGERGWDAFYLLYIQYANQHPVYNLKFWQGYPTNNPSKF